jgi:hypothetical protein
MLLLLLLMLQELLLGQVLVLLLLCKRRQLWRQLWWRGNLLWVCVVHVHPLRPVIQLTPQLCHEGHVHTLLLLLLLGSRHRCRCCFILAVCGGAAVPRLRVLMRGCGSTSAAGCCVAGWWVLAWI